jgi:hypothetical protein
MEGQESDILPITLESATLCEVVHFCDGGTAFLHSTYRIVVFV